jgi:hypothetical protein
MTSHPQALFGAGAAGGAEPGAAGGTGAPSAAEPTGVGNDSPHDQLESPPAASVQRSMIDPSRRIELMTKPLLSTSIARKW